MAVAIEEGPYTPSEQWELTCSQCFQTIPSSRHPSMSLESRYMCTCDNSSKVTPEYQYTPSESSSFSSTDFSTDGLEEADPMASLHVNVSLSLSVSNHYLPLAPAAGLNEIQHRRSASFRSEMSLRMREFMEELRGDEEREEKGFISQEVYVMGQSYQMERGRKHSLVSTATGSSSGVDVAMGMDGAGVGEADMTGMGAWDGDGGGGGEEESLGCFLYPLAMSGLSGSGYSVV